MELTDVFVTEYLSDRDTETTRVCGTCGKVKDVSAFYKDGKDSHGKTRYRRDCRECYKLTRIAERRYKNK